MELKVKWGGIAGLMDSRSKITDSWSSADVYGSTEVGGIVGKILPNGGAPASSVSNANFSGTVTAIGNVGGIAGILSRTAGVTTFVNNTFNSGTVNQTGALNVDAGGIVGSLQGFIFNSYNTGAVFGYRQIR